MLRLLRPTYSKNKSICKIVKEKEIQANIASFGVRSQPEKGTATVCDKCFVKIEKALNFGVENMNRKHVPTDDNVLHQKALSL